MKKENERWDGPANEYWQPSSDLMSGLLMMVMLAMLALALYVMQVPEDDFDGYQDTPNELGSTGNWEGPSVTPTLTPTITPTLTPAPLAGMGGGAGGGGGDGGGGDGTGGGTGGGEGDQEGGGNYEQPGFYPDPGLGTKAAVFATVIDTETGRQVMQDGVTFELHFKDGRLAVLNSYYPERASYRNFATEQDGSFYLPEKVPLGDYFFRQLTEIPGYDPADDTYLVLDEDYDWPDPYVARLEVSPSKNSVAVQLVDSITGEPVPGGSFSLMADGEIRTLDGTLRAKPGENIAGITCDEDGKGESEEVYLGTYLLAQTEIPKWYASLGKDISVDVEKKGLSDGIVEIPMDRTTITVSCVDELEGSPLEGAKFLVDNGKTKTTCLTGDDGTFTIDEIEKAGTYTITQISAPGDWRASKQETIIDVGTNGRIAGEAAVTEQFQDRVIRTLVSARDMLFGTPLSDISMVLYDKDGNVVSSWTGSASEKEFTDLEEGTYQLALDGEENHKRTFSVEDTADRQHIAIRVFTRKDRVVMLAGAIVAASAAFLGTVISRILRNKKKKEAEEE